MPDFQLVMWLGSGALDCVITLLCISNTYRFFFFSF
uniref:Uncharacterized protein n=1 Tax=Anguilla anguilla TaxID=7936 RepID=A0A0E9Q1H2_ANGAN